DPDDSTATSPSHRAGSGLKHVKRNLGVPGKQENFSMVCSMVKKGLLGAALGAGALYLVFGTSAPSYVKTASHKVRKNARNAVAIQFEIDRARGEIANLEPAIKDNIEVL